MATVRQLLLRKYPSVSAADLDDIAGMLGAKRRTYGLNDIAQASHENAIVKGFYEQIHELLLHPHLTTEQKDFIQLLWRGNRLMLIVTELAEAYEGLRHGNMSCDPKSGGFGEELADAQIRLADLAASEDIDLEVAVDTKAAFNASREYKHGGKRS